MNFTENRINECRADSERWFPGIGQNLPFMTLCLAGEVGELANMVKKVERGSLPLTKEVRIQLAHEVNDIRVYLYNIMGLDLFKDIDWEEIWCQKREFNESRFYRHPSNLRPIKDNPQA